MSVISTSVRAQASGAACPSGSFESAASDALSNLREATIRAVESVGGGRLNSLALSRKLGIDKSLSWRMLRFAQDADVFSASKHLPGDAGLRIFARAVRTRHAAPEAVANFLSAAEQLEAVARQHAGGRSAFRAMLSHCTAEPQADDRANEFRKSAFQANAALWGIEAQARVMLAFVIPGDRGSVDMAIVSGFLGLRRMRRDLAWPVAPRRAAAMPLDPSIPMDEPPLLSGFSSLRADTLRTVGAGHGSWHELPEGDVGSAGAVDCFFGERVPGAPHSPKQRSGRNAEAILRLDVPVDHVLFDVFVDRSLPIAGEPTAALHGLLTGEHAADRDRNRVPMVEVPVEIAMEPRAWATGISPRHWELVQDCLRWLNRPAAAFRAHRLTMRWPLIPTALVVSTPLGAD
jgi:hypothetical protein